LKNITISPASSIRDAMNLLDQTAEKCLLVIDSSGRLLGTLTDGDIRRKILGGTGFSEPISKTYNDCPITLLENEFTKEEAKKILKEKKLPLLPVLNDEKIVTDYITWQRIGSKAPSSKVLNDVPVVIMAGGKGSRLKPFTDILPKPLVPLRDKTIIEHIIDQFLNFGCREFYVSVNYKSKIIKAYFEELNPEYKITFIEEDSPLGTAGGLKFFRNYLRNPFFVSNCDILVKTNLEKLFLHHLEGGYTMSLVASARDYVIPYGTCDLLGDGSLNKITEKPSFDLLVNTGLYVMDSSVLNYIPESKVFHTTCMVDAVKNDGGKVGVFPVNESAWVDIGQWSEYKNALNKFF
jgi:dTDP-glucose pyrophosphorylase